MVRGVRQYKEGDRGILRSSRERDVPRNGALQDGVNPMYNTQNLYLGDDIIRYSTPPGSTAPTEFSNHQVRNVRRN